MPEEKSAKSSFWWWCCVCVCCVIIGLAIFIGVMAITGTWDMNEWKDWMEGAPVAPDGERTIK